MSEIIDVRPELSVAEQSRLEELTGVVDRHLKSFMEVGRALAEIKATGLYRATHENFHDFCKEKWDMGRRYADMQIASYEVTANLCSNENNCSHLQLPSPSQFIEGQQPVLRLPLNESQVRPLVGLPEPKQLEIWQTVCEQAGPDGKITAAMVQAAVKGEQVRETKDRLNETRRKSREDQVSQKVHSAFTDLIDVIGETIDGKFRDCSKVAMLRYLDGLQEVRERIAKM